MPMGDMTYTIFSRGGDNDVGGLMHRPDERIPPNWTHYIATADVDATISKAKELGAQNVMGPMDVPGQGRFAIITDPTGAVFGAWQGES
jgi:predicted enzyme related to lactoylglutathione lyase